jgi:hypothetical protein
VSLDWEEPRKYKPKLGTTLPEWVRNAEVEDATEPITINVRREDIEAGKNPQDGNSCVVSQCALRALGAYEVYCYRQVCYVVFDRGEKVQRFAVSNKLRSRVIVPLDDGDYDAIEPGLYQLTPMWPSKRLGAEAAYQATLKAQRERGERPPVQRRGPQAHPRQVRGRIRSARGEQ